MTTELPSLDDVVAEHLTRMREEGRLNVRAEPRCRVCRDPQVRPLVNELLTAKQLSGVIGPRLTYRDILAALEPVNRARAPGDQITYSSLWVHSRRHFDVHVRKLAVEIYRDIQQRRARGEMEPINI